MLHLTPKPKFSKRKNLNFEDETGFDEFQNERKFSFNDNDDNNNDF
jgi:hypothetical protein